MEAVDGGGRDGPRARPGLGGGARPPPPPPPQQNHQGAARAAAGRLAKPSYWLDLWLFVLVDLVLFVLVYLWPW